MGVTQKEVNKVYATLVSLYQDCNPQKYATIYPADHEGLPEGSWSIAWEGAPEDWTDELSRHWRETNPLSTIFVEPRNCWSVGVHKLEKN